MTSTCHIRYNVSNSELLERYVKLYVWPTTAKYTHLVTISADPQYKTTLTR